MELRARRNLYFSGRMINKGEVFTAEAYQAQQLIGRRLALPVNEYEQQTTAPTETQNPANFLVEPQREPEETPEAPLDDLEYKDLKQMAKEAGIKGYNRMKRDELIKQLGGR